MSLNTARIRYRRFLCGLLAVALAGMGFLTWRQAREEIPDEVRVFAGRDPSWEELFDFPFVSYEDAVEVSGNGSYRIDLKIFGVIPLKTVKVSPLEEQQVYASGSPVGIYMETKGILVIDCGQIRGRDGISRMPAEHIVQSGDYICSVNGEEVSDKDRLMELVAECEGQTMELEVLRGGERITLALTPVLAEDGTYKLGIWVRDNIQGIGTLTCVTGSGRFAALGHGISDIDTGTRLEIEDGELYHAQILSIQKGENGNPGELRGVINYEKSQKIGEIGRNTANGIVGQLDSLEECQMNLQEYEIGLKQELTTGPASILCNVDGQVEEYSIEITDIDWNSQDTNKSFEIHVTDKNLLEKTGGIVQGMSGSPILQNGKLVGAVTHVFIQDSAGGYGIFIENMLESME